ncbi:MAG: ABC transporter substrate binding protein [Roseibium sp.]
MNLRSLLSIIALALSLSGWPLACARADESETVFMLTWRGKTAAEFSFIETLAASGREIELIEFDADRDRSALAKFLRSNIAEIRSADGIYTFGTLTSRIVQNLGLETVPHVFNIVADPVGAGLVDELYKPGGLRTGAKSAVPLSSVLLTLSNAIQFSNVAVIFDPREMTSEIQLNEMSALVEAMGKSVKGIRYVPDASNAAKQLETIRAQLQSVDLVFVPAASSLVTHMASIAKVVPETAVTVGAVEVQARNGATIAIGTDFTERGKVAGNIMLSILDGADPASIPVNEVQMEDAKIVIDLSDPRSAMIDFDAMQGKIVTHGEPWNSGKVPER